MPGMEWNEKDSMSNEHARDRWATMTLQGTRQPKFLPTGSCCLSTLATDYNCLGLGPNLENSGPASVGG